MLCKFNDVVLGSYKEIGVIRCTGAGAHEVTDVLHDNNIMTTYDDDARQYSSTDFCDHSNIYQQHPWQNSKSPYFLGWRYLLSKLID